jgi:hypothetical protein
MDEFNTYTLSLNAISYGTFPSISQIKNIKIYQIDPSFFLSTPQKNNQQLSSNFHSILPNNSFIKVNISNKIINPNTYLSLFQSYNSGWLAFYFDDYGRLQTLKHILVNNWANGWEIPSNLSSLKSNIYIFFWPQLLEFFGFILLLIPLFLLLNPQNPSPHNP